MPDPEDELDKLSNAIAVLETQRSMLGDAVVEPAISALRQKLIQLEAERDEAETNDERKLVTVVFSDLSGFTALSESLDPEEVRELVNACFDALVPVVLNGVCRLLLDERADPA
ncbi:MAG: adenylate/guanylate cyclase domain-containing protein [Chthoniobacterales bacterium]